MYILVCVYSVSVLLSELLFNNCLTTTSVQTDSLKAKREIDKQDIIIIIVIHTYSRVSMGIYQKYTLKEGLTSDSKHWPDLDPTLLLLRNSRMNSTPVHVQGIVLKLAITIAATLRVYTPNMVYTKLVATAGSLAHLSFSPFSSTLCSYLLFARPPLSEIYYM